MRRGFWIKTHLFLATFFAPLILMMAYSGGCYLLGFKGTTEKAPVTLSTPGRLTIDSPSLEQDVRNLFDANGLDSSFEYLKINGSTLTTRPTSRDHYEIKVSGRGVTVSQVTPDLQKRVVELHKGHGPLWFKDFQKVMAAGLIIVLITGMWLGISAAGLRTSTLVTSGAGLAAFLVLGFLV